jgi:hypothetical protein
MTHEYEGRYRAKHDPRTPLDPTLARLIGEKSKDSRLTCAAAFAIARESGASPADVGQAADLLETKITGCQLGLFGHGQGRGSTARPAQNVPDQLEEALRTRAVNGRLPCAAAWELAKQFDLPKADITAACENLKIRVGPCQLGVF